MLMILTEQTGVAEIVDAFAKEPHLQDRETVSWVRSGLANDLGLEHSRNTGGGHRGMRGRRSAEKMQSA